MARSISVSVRSLVTLLLAVAGSALVPAAASAYEVHISITGAGQVTETTPADLVGTGCVTSANNPTGTVGMNCYPGDPGGDYGYGWTVRYVATAKPGYHFVQWQSDGSPKPVICDGATNGSSTYTGSACQFATFDNLQTRAVFEDTTAPSMASLSGPNSAVNGATTFTFSATADPTLSGFECRVVNVHDWTPCSSGRSENPAGSGAYTFDVRAVDASGNRSSISSWGWTVDKVTPETTLDSGSGPADGSTTSSRSASFQFNSNEAGDFVCTRDGVAVTPCGSPKSFSGLSDGEHTFTVAARDTAGNVDPSPASRTWTVDGTPPVPSIGTGPADGSSTQGDSATFGFSANEPVTYQCRLYLAASSAPPFGACTGATSHTASGLAPGTYRFDVRAVDAASNAATTGRTFTLTTAPSGGDQGDTPGGGTPGGGVPGGSTPGGGTPAGGTPPDTVAPLMGLPRKALVVSHGAFSLKVACPGTEFGGCTGRVTVKTKKAIASAARKRRVTFGSASFALAAGQSKTLKLKLSRANKRLLTKLRKVAVMVTAVAKDAAGNSGTATRALTLKIG